MKPFCSTLTRQLAASLVVVIVTVLARSAEQSPPSDPGWPRVFKQDSATLTVYQPQLVEWTGYTNLSARCAIALQAAPDKGEVYGILELNADTIVDRDARTVTTANPRRQVRFPSVPDNQQADLVRLVDSLLPERQSMVISLDRLLAYMERSNVASREVSLNLDPPKIFYSAEPAILVIFLGPPQFKPVEKESKLLFAINTNWDVFFDSAAGLYYLLETDHWLEATDPVKGPWTIARSLPDALGKLPANPNWEDVRAHIPGKSVQRAPVVIVSTEPAEMIVTQGEPTFQPIPGTSLMQIANTDSTVFLHAKEGQFYFLVAGRWCRAKGLVGPWQAATLDLPADFRMIPDDSQSAFVKASVPGTRQAEDAVLLASVPKRAAVDRSSANLVVQYDGQPKFIPIQGTTVSYAINSPQAVFLVNNMYYCCDQGVWFAAPKPTGVWVLCSDVPAAIYTIPPTSPMYNVTYVIVVSATPTVVVYQYTAGYEGLYCDAASDLLMFGAGMMIGAAITADYYEWWPWYYSYHCYGCYFSYGCGAVYRGEWGGYYRYARYYGPYGGAGCGAIYNPSTGGYARGAYRYGPYGTASVREAYNPHTDTYFAHAEVKTPYGSSGRFYAERGGNEAWGGHQSGARGAVGWARGDDGQGVIRADTSRGQGFVAKDKEGDIYAGHDGNIYKKDESGWHPVEPLKKSLGQTPARTTTSRDRVGSARINTRVPAEANIGAVQKGLDRDAAARTWGNRQASQFSGVQRPGAGGGVQRPGAGGGVQRPGAGGGGRRR